MKLREIYSQSYSQARNPEPAPTINIQQVEKFADAVFSKVGIDVNFTRHFIDRLYDPRNGEPITAAELTKLFKQEAQRWGRPIAQMGKDAEAVMKDLSSDINVPFVLKWDPRNREFDLVAKTIMRKPNFKSPDKIFPVESQNQNIENHENGTYAALYMSEQSAKDLVEWCNENGIEAQDADEMHCTLIYSESPVKELQDFDGKQVECSATIKGWKQLGDALTLELDFPQAEKLNEIMTRAGATSKFPDYIAHTTINPEYSGDVPKNIPNVKLQYNRVKVSGLDPNRGTKTESAKLDVKTLSPLEIAKLHNVSPRQIESQLQKGIKAELEHTTDEAVAREIALDHLKEMPNYYDKLKRIENESQ